MKNKISKLVLSLMVGILMLASSVGVVAAAGGPPAERGVGRGNSEIGSVTEDALNADQLEAMTEFWLDEYKALRTYEAIIVDFGALEPFVSIARAETMHIESLERAFDRYGVVVPSIPESLDVDFETLEDACSAAVQAEIDNAGLYEELETAFTQADLLRVFENLSTASLENHLPAFEACAEGDYVHTDDGTMMQQQLGGNSQAGTQGSQSNRQVDSGTYNRMSGNQDSTREPAVRWNGRTR